MKHLKIFENYQTEAEVAKICQEYGIKNCSINQDGLVDVAGNVNLSYKGLKKLPLKFGTVSGYFDCSVNKLTTLEGAPLRVGDGFFCSDNKLTTLEGAPQSVDGNFFCHNNQLTTLEGAPQSVGGNFWCDTNPLPDLIKNNIKWIKHILANQEMYHIYNKDGSINRYRFKLMMDSMD